MKRYLETNYVEFKRSWRDEWLKWICAFANSEGGILYIGVDEKKREVVGVADPQRLLEDVPLFRKHSSEARNELIAGALYRGGFVETWGRGIEKVCRECEKFGVPRPEYEATESDVMVCLHARVNKAAPGQGASSTPQESPYDAPHDTPHEKVILKALEMQALSAPELMQIVGVVNRKDFRTRILAPLLVRQLVEMTLPDKPKSKNQAYRLTEKGKEHVATIERRGQPKTMTMVFDSHGCSRIGSVAPALTTKNNACVVEVYSLDDEGDGGRT